MFLPRPKKRRKCFYATVSTSLQNLNECIGVAVFESVDSLLVFDYFYKTFSLNQCRFLLKKRKVSKSIMMYLCAKVPHFLIKCICPHELDYYRISIF